VKTSAALSATAISFDSIVLAASNSLPTAGGNVLALSGFAVTTALNSANNVVISATSSHITIGNITSGSNTETGSAVLQYAQQLMQAGHYYSNDCWYTTSAVGGETSITATFTNQTPANILNMTFFVTDYKCVSTCASSFDASQNTAYVVASQCTNCAIAAMPTTGTNDTCLQLAEFGAVWLTTSSVLPYTEIDNDNNAGNTLAAMSNQTSCPAITWTQNSNNIGLFSTYAFKFIP
jgi:hypothetical protein